jgi:hypothetical protein
LLSLQIGFHVCMLAGCMWVVFSVWRTGRMPDASYNSTNKQTKTVWSFLGSKTSPFAFVDFLFCT